MNVVPSRFARVPAPGSTGLDPTGRRRPDRRLVPVVGLLVFLVACFVPLPRVAAQTDTATTASSAEIELTIGQAVVLGLVEGITEFLPVSSTGHLLVTSRLMGLDDTDAARDAIDSYSIAIQAGAMLAVVGLYWRRFLTLVEGILGRSDEGRRLLVALVVAFLPAAVFGLLLGDLIKDNLFGYGPIAAAWLVGGVAILVFERRRAARGDEGSTLAQLTPRAALTIGLVQTIAMWPGVSRSLVTIVAALAVGLAMKDAVEFSFLLGAVTLGAATVYEGGRSGGEIIDTFGWAAPLVGVAVAFVSAAAAVAWLLSFLTKRGLAAFGWYRIAIGVVTLVALSAGWL